MGNRFTFEQSFVEHLCFAAFLVAWFLFGYRFHTVPMRISAYYTGDFEAFFALIFGIFCHFYEIKIYQKRGNVNTFLQKKLIMKKRVTTPAAKCQKTVSKRARRFVVAQNFTQIVFAFLRRFGVVLRFEP
ncbi:MAG: hypothetical protein ACI4QL_02175 [Candidatus Fimimonas sp.]